MYSISLIATSHISILIKISLKLSHIHIVAVNVIVQMYYTLNFAILTYSVFDLTVINAF